MKNWVARFLQEESGKPSGKRLGGLLSLLCLQIVFLSVAFVLLHREKYAELQALFDSQALLVASFFGLAVLHNLTKGKGTETTTAKTEDAP